ncbi:MAG: hypothetical protein ABS81_18035 [Pseudonocardia sp. SCN 72-86]|nr:MAG: hypothetical protein ABS81_18035 [Pseudonocardia sp. SCN 72-86]
MTEPVVREIEIDAMPETVFAFFVEPAKLTRWLADEAVLDPRTGGLCVQVHPGEERGSGGPFHMSGRFVEVDPPRRVVFTWGFTEPEVGVPPDSSTVEVTLRPNGSGTTVRLVHRGLPPSEAGNHEQGWAAMLGRLAAAIGRPAESGRAMHHEIWIEAPRKDVYAALTTRDGLDAWWGRAVVAEPEIGSVVEFDHGFGIRFGCGSSTSSTGSVSSGSAWAGSTTPPTRRRTGAGRGSPSS